MKKLFITAIIPAMFSVTAFADGGKKTTTGNGEEKASGAAVTLFKNSFKNVDNVLWTVTSKCQKVSFTSNNVEYTAFYNFGSEYLGLTHDVAYNTLSESVKKQITENYKGYVVSHVIKYETQDNEELEYSVRVRTTDSSAVVKATANDAVVYFIDLKSVADEVMLQVTPDENVTALKQD